MRLRVINGDSSLSLLVNLWLVPQLFVTGYCCFSVFGIGRFLDSSVCFWNFSQQTFCLERISHVENEKTSKNVPRIVTVSEKPEKEKKERKRTFSLIKFPGFNFFTNKRTSLNAITNERMRQEWLLENNAEWF